MSVEDVVLKALAGRGVVRVRLLGADEVARVRELEESYSRQATAWGRPVNLGVEECLKRRYVLAALTSPDFKWPPGPYALIKIGDRVVGVIDERGFRLSAREVSAARGDHVVEILPLRLPELEGAFEEPVAASPSPPTHRYLAGLLGCAGDCGSLLVAFNGLRVTSSFVNEIYKEARGEGQ